MSKADEQLESAWADHRALIHALQHRTKAEGDEQSATKQEQDRGAIALTGSVGTVQTDSNSIQADCTERDQDRASKNDKSLLERVGILGGLLGVFVLIIQSCINRRTLDEMIKQRSLDERAWVACQVNEGKSINSGSEIKLVISLKNTGKTPALNVQNISGIRYATNGIPTFAYEHNAMGQVMIPPNSMNLEVVIQLREIDIQALGLGKTAYCYVIVWYDDIFKIHHWSRCCYKIRPDRTGAICDFANDCDSDETDK